jgi:hypothetical protein
MHEAIRDLIHVHQSRNSHVQRIGTNRHGEIDPDSVDPPLVLLLQDLAELKFCVQD